MTGVEVTITRVFDNGVRWLAVVAPSREAAREAALAYGRIREADQDEQGRYTFAVDPHDRLEDSGRGGYTP